ncbi:MAG: 16S rRNA processing protein RimM [Pelagibacteraceae bacterium]|nr:16S rRNA processing protein RimM [Pelagibacteraceae bacterium]HJO14033.1 ribosome maturation factor RimM [Alphaproteobacteria bacterium]MBO6467959.1 16S rRNA processing protein RimM [Pelagibacteraceae bacterium]MBO6469758.1 16S rRNA processing protein RimM [Pelagibacteraceae bacterium]MBO6471748.1 16S rRNA processing protein RimM [Pelagibacteraceae bacterium]
MKKKQLFHIGTFGKPIGLKGKIKIIMHNFEFNKFKSKSLSPYLVDEANVFWNFQYLKINNNKLTGKLEKCNSINCAEKLNGKRIFIDINHLPKNKKNQFYIFDLINCEVKTSKNILLGSIIDVDNFGAGDLLKIKKDINKSFYIPMNEDNVVKVDLKKKLVIVNPVKGILN